MVGVVLAGGENRRMPVPKAFLKVDKTTIIERLLALHHRLCSRVLIVTRTPGAYAGLGTDLVGDVYPARGPIVGILSALLNIERGRAFVTACDMPWVEDGWAGRLLKLSEGYDLTLPVGPAGLEPLCAVYGRGVIPAIEDLLKTRRKSLLDLLDRVRTRRVPAVELGLSPHQARRAFANINTPDDYEREIGGMA